MNILHDNINDFTLEELIANASKERVEYAEKYRDDNDKKRHLLGERLLKKALNIFGHHGKFKIFKGEHGKPYTNIKNFHFNISHSNEIVVVAYAQKDIGVDIEFHKTRDYNRLKDNFHKEEQEFIENSFDKLGAFYSIWTLKESYLKAVGIGLLESLDSFYVVPNRDGTFRTSLKDIEFNQKFLHQYTISVCFIKDESYIENEKWRIKYLG